MRRQVVWIPHVTVFLALGTEELASKILFLIGQRPDLRTFHFASLKGEIWSQNIDPLPPIEWQQRKDDVNLALVEAFSWLETQGLIVPSPSSDVTDGWRVLSRRARQFQNDTDFQS